MATSKKGRLVEELLKIIEDHKDDKEAMHAAADEALLRYIDDPEVSATFHKAAAWYG